MSLLLHASSTNPGKLREFALAGKAAGSDSVIIEPLPNLSAIAPPHETGATYEDNARLKAIYYSGFSRELVFADDSGLEINALNGAPGTRSARYAGDNATMQDNVALVLRQINGIQNRDARFVCVVALASRGRLLQTFYGSVDGKILNECRGSEGFGYDPLFLYEPMGRTFGQIPDTEKFSVSARGRALLAMFAWLRQNPMS
jgi:XTP/dITP diphosphohydrolase